MDNLENQYVGQTTAVYHVTASEDVYERFERVSLESLKDQETDEDNLVVEPNFEVDMDDIHVIEFR